MAGVNRPDRRRPPAPAERSTTECTVRFCGGGGTGRNVDQAKRLSSKDLRLLAFLVSLGEVLVEGIRLSDVRFGYPSHIRHLAKKVNGAISGSTIND